MVDAVDECSDRRMVSKLLRVLLELSDIQLVVFNQRETDIELALQGAAHEIALTIAAVDNDIAIYVKHRMKSSDDMAFWAPEDKAKVQDSLTPKADGM